MDNVFIQQPEANTAPAFSLGTVIATAPNLLVGIEAGTTRTVPMRRLVSYTPTVGDRVLLARISGTYVILGRVV